MKNFEKIIKDCFYYKIYTPVCNYILSSKLKKISYKFKIIPIGTYCLPRCLTTFAHIKPRKEDGELTCPFDLAFFNDINCITNLLNNDFADFFDYVEYDNSLKQYKNESIKAIFNHDGKLNKEQFIQRYKKRIENFHSYINSSNHFIFFILASFNKISDTQIQNLVSALHKFTANFRLVIINQSDSKYFTSNKSVSIINYDYKCRLFNKINKTGNWVNELKSLRRYAAIRFFYRVNIKILQIINNTFTTIK